MVAVALNFFPPSLTTASIKQEWTWNLDLTILSLCFSLSLCSYFGVDPVLVAPQVIRPPPPDLVQQHSPLPTPALGNSPIHRPSPSPSPPYVKAPQSGPGRPSPVSGTGSQSSNHSILRERRNSTSSVTVTGGRTVVTSVSSTERSGVIHRCSRVFIIFMLMFVFIFYRNIRLQSTDADWFHCFERHHVTATGCDSCGRHSTFATSAYTGGWTVQLAQS